jgi:hypothetical protein
MFIALTMIMVMPVFAERVTPETAQKVATTFLNGNGAKAAQLTDLSKAAGFPNLYIFTAEEGFVVMSADDCAKPILGYSLTDKFVVEEMPENLRWWLQQYSDEIQWAIENNILSDNSTATEWLDLKEGNASKDTPTVVVGPLLETQWNQDSPYNMYCPSGTVTGCVATAMAQVMKYWNYPEQGQGSHTNENNSAQTINFGETTYDWANMTNIYGSSSTDAQKQAVATLMYHCGVSVDMEYGESSGAISAKVPIALVEYFKYSPSASYKLKESYTNDQWIALLQSELDENRPVFYAGRYIKNNGEGGGHAFVCDGYRSDNYFHFNWGWGGYQNNKYWAIGALNPGSGGTGSGSGTYNLNNGAAFWVEPISSLTAPTLSVTTTDRAINLSWTAVEEASGYDIYKDNHRIVEGITDLSYTDNDVVSAQYYEYYVRAVSATEKSNLSNTVTKCVFFRDYEPTNLSLTISSDNANLSWDAPVNNSTDIHYGIDANPISIPIYGFGDEDKDTYWAEAFSPSRLSNYAGMHIQKVSSFLHVFGDYKLFIYENDPSNENNKLYERTFTNSGQTWMDIDITSPIVIDPTKTLWIILYYPTTGTSGLDRYPATTCNYSEIPYDDETNEERSNPRWIGKSLSNWSYLDENYSWLMNTYLTDGTYTYNLYQDGEKIVENISETNYSGVPLNNNATNLFTVTTNYYGGESEASNKVGFSLGTVSRNDLELGDNDNMTVAQNSTLTVENLTNTNPNNLILENGAQLIHNSTGVKATVKKIIDPTNGDDQGWNFIASPVVESIEPSEDNGLLSGNYDLYFYEEPTHMWRNYKEHIVSGINQNTASGFHLNYKQGYLYANSTSDTLQFSGTLTPSNSTDSINNLSYSASTLTGFNLVGNPYAHNVTSYTGNNVATECYRMNENRSNIIISTIDEDKPLLPAEGFFVKAIADNASIIFNSNSRSETTQSASIHLDLISDNLTFDRLIVKREGEPLEKLSLRESGTKIFAMKGNQEIAVAIAEGNEQAVSFKAEENGIFTLRVKVEPKEWRYLHLIDNITGADIDLLATPEYSFEARTDDYVSRFKLVFFATEDVYDDAPFAYISNGEIRIIGKAQDFKSLQIMDMTGRIVINRDVASNVSTNGLSAGVYVLRLINGNQVKTQKVLVP